MKKTILILGLCVVLCLFGCGNSHTNDDTTSVDTIDKSEQVTTILDGEVTEIKSTVDPLDSKNKWYREAEFWGYDYPEATPVLPLSKYDNIKSGMSFEELVKNYGVPSYLHTSAANIGYYRTLEGYLFTVQIGPEIPLDTDECKEIAPGAYVNPSVVYYTSVVGADD